MLSNFLPLFYKILTPKWNVTKDVAYGKLPEQKVDYYQLNDGVRPAIVLIHGGGWMIGDKADFAGTAKQYALAGYNVFAINYTLAKAGAPLTHWDAQLRDVELFMRWLRKNATNLRVDPNNIVACGGSAGGHLALFLATTKDPTIKVKAVLNLCGPTDVSAPEIQPLLKTTPVFGDNPSNKLLKSASPLTYVDRETSPIFTIHGLHDNVVPYPQATALKTKLDSYGVRNELLSYNGSHGYVNVPWYVQMYLNIQGLWFLNNFV